MIEVQHRFARHARKVPIGSMYIYTHRINVYIPIGCMYGIFTYIWLKFMVNVGEYNSPMDPMGYIYIDYS